ncbi:uncharacterized protein LOC143276105 [Babylonia areolata]|uniref:uncharacterized protein LOC143276105 n=1 Tax=Babylonia areolata TaxID=304850 RepID=UPI003FCFE491
MSRPTTRQSIQQARRQREEESVRWGEPESRRSIRAGRRRQPEVEESDDEQEFESVGHHEVEADAEITNVKYWVNKLGRCVIRYKWFIMTNFGMASAFCLIGVWIGMQRGGVKEDSSVMIVNEVLDRLRQGREGRAVAMTLMPTLREEIRQSQAQCALESENKWNEKFQTQSEAADNFKQEYEKEIKNLTQYIESIKLKLSAAEDKTRVQMTDMQHHFNVTLQKELEDAKNETYSKIDVEFQKWIKVREEFRNFMNLFDQITEIKGFLKIDTVGPLLLGLGLVEALLTIGMCVLCSRGLSRNVQQHHHHPASSPPPPPSAAAQASPPLISTNNSNLVCLCFRHSDEKLTRTLGAKLLESCPVQGLALRTFVVNAMEDVPEIPACRAALVFVDPDEREMIIEDERYHIGQGLRRHAVQRLLDSGVEVFIIIFKDKNSATMPEDQRYNPKLGQVDEHAQLKRLKRKDRVVSIKDRFHDHQTALIVQELGNVFR